MDARQTLGQVIRARRLALGLTQEELAERIGDGVRQAEVSRLECDRVSLPRRRRLTRIASALELSVGELLASAGWLVADAALRPPTPTVADLPVTEPAPAIVPREVAARTRHVPEASTDLWAAIERSRALQARTTHLLEVSTALAARWWSEETRRHRPSSK